MTIRLEVGFRFSRSPLPDRIRDFYKGTWEYQSRTRTISFRGSSECDGDGMVEVELKTFGRDDFDRLMSWVNESPEFMVQWAGPAIFRYPLDRAQLEDYVKGSEGIQPHRMVFKAIYDDKVVGHIDLDKINLQHRSASICRVLIGEASSRGKGFGTRMVKNVLGMAFDKLGLHRVSLHVYDRNSAAISLYERLGFVKEGHLRDVNRVGNEFWSSYIMSILETDWRKMNPK